MTTWGVARGGITAVVGAVMVLAGTAVPPAALADESGGSHPGTAEESGPLREGQIVTVAGTGEEGFSGDGHDALDARIRHNASISAGPDGSLYIADYTNERLRVVSPGGGIDTVPGTEAQRARYGSSHVVRASAVGPDGSLYLATTDGIRRVDESGDHHVIGGDGDEVFADGGDGGPATQAQIDEPSDIAVGHDGSVYVADGSNYRVRRIDPDGTITTIAGGGELSLGENEGGQATESQIFYPQSVAVDSAGTVFVAHSSERPGDSPHLDVEWDILDTGVVSEIAPDGTISTLVGNNAAGFSGDGGPVKDARLGNKLRGLAVDAEDNVYIADKTHGVVRRVDGAGVISTVGAEFGGLSIDVQNDTARIDAVHDIAVGPDGNLYFAAGAQVKMFVLNAEPLADDEQSDADAKFPWSDRDPGEVVTVAGTERDPDGVEKVEDSSDDSPVELMDEDAEPRHIAVGPDGTVYYTVKDRHQVGAVAPDGTVTVIGGTGEAGSAGDGGPAADAEMDSPGGLAVDDEGVVYVAEKDRVRMIDQDGVINTVTEAPAIDLAVGPDGTLHVAANSRPPISRVDADGEVTAVAGGGDLVGDEAEGAQATEVHVSEPGSVAVDGDGNVYFTENGASRVRVVAPNGEHTTLTGANRPLGPLGLGFAGDGGPADEAKLNTPNDLAGGPDGDVYVADMYNARVRRIDADATIDTVAGTGEQRDAGDDGPAVDAPVHEPSSVAVGSNGALYLTSPEGGKVRVVDTDGTISTLADVSGESDQTGSEDAGDIELRAHDIAAEPGGSLYVTDTIAGPLVVHPDGSTSSMRSSDSAEATAHAGDGSFYASIENGVIRVYPDGASLRVTGGQLTRSPLDEMAHLQHLRMAELAVDPDGVLYMLDEGGTDDSGEEIEPKVYRLEQDGTLTVMAELGEDVSTPTGFAVDDDARLYLADEVNNRVIGIDDDGSVSTVAGEGGSLAGSDASDGDGGDATEATVARPQDVAVAEDGTVYIADRAGVRRVDSGGTISTLYEAPEDNTGDGQAPRALSIGSNGDVYFVDTSTEQVRVIVQADEVPNPNPFPWKVTAAVGLPLIVVVGAALGIWRRCQLVELIQRLRRRGDVDADPDDGDGEAAAASTS